MYQESMTEKRRAELLRRFARAQASHMNASEKEDFAVMDRAEEEMERAEALYHEELPRVVMSCCPFDGKPLVRTFDPFGFDGFWWQPDATPAELPTCTHFCVLRGGVHYRNLKPKGGPFEVHAGPEVPHVIPRILDKPGMIAVISQIQMQPGFIVYLIAYFAKRRPPVQELTANWPRKIFTYADAFGRKGWDFVNDPWDFDLMPWARIGKLRWCPIASDNTALSLDPPDQCPYLNIEGQRTRIVIQGDIILARGLPDGTTIQLMDGD